MIPAPTWPLVATQEYDAVCAAGHDAQWVSRLYGREGSTYECRTTANFKCQACQ